MRNRIASALAIVALCLSLAGSVLAGDTPDKYKDLDRLKDKDAIVALAFKETDIKSVFGAIEKMGATNISYGEGFPAGTKITVSWEKGPYKDMLIDLAEKFGLAYEVTAPDALVVKGAAAKK